MNPLFRILLLTLFSAALLAPLFLAVALPHGAVLAQGPSGLLNLPRSDCETAPAGPLQCFWNNIVCRVVLWTFAIVIVISFIMILVSAYKFMTGGGDEKAISDARKLLTFALVGLIVALLARTLVFVIAGFVGIQAVSLSFFTC